MFPLLLILSASLESRLANFITTHALFLFIRPSVERILLGSRGQAQAWVGHFQLLVMQPLLGLWTQGGGRGLEGHQSFQSNL